MSKANSPMKVLRTAINRVEKNWTKNAWSSKLEDGGRAVCLEGALFGYCMLPTTQVQIDARNVVLKILREGVELENSQDDEEAVIFESIPEFNDHWRTTKDNVLRVLKLALIRLETTDSLEEALADEVEEMYSDN